MNSNDGHSAGFWSESGTLLERFEIDRTQPIHAEYPAWPGKSSAFLYFKTRQDTAVLCTQGLHRPDNRKSLNLELYIESPGPIEEIGSSWHMHVIYATAAVAAGHGGLAGLLKSEKYLTVQLDVADVPEAYHYTGEGSEHGNLGVFLGLPNPELPEPAGYAWVNLKVMTAIELEFVLDYGPQARMELSDLYAEQGNQTISDFERPSVVYFED